VARRSQGYFSTRARFGAFEFRRIFAGQNVGVTQVGEHVWLVTFMHYDLGYFDDETCRLEPIENRFGPKLLPMSPE
jgi:putative transposase